MIDYLKIIILALFTGATMPLPTSSAARFSFLNDVLSFNDDGAVLSFFYSVFSVVFSIVVFCLLRKIYIKSIKSFFVKTENSSADYRKIAINILLSVLLSAVLLIPISTEKLLMDYFATFLSESGLLLTAIASIICALILFTSRWYTRQNYAPTKRNPGTRNVLRMSFYQLIAYVVPGMSHVSIGAANLLICDVDSKVLVREIYIYLAPQMFTVGLIRIIRALAADIIVDPLVLVTGVVIFAAISIFVLKIMSKVNIRRLFVFFSIYSAAFGVLAGILSFII